MAFVKFRPITASFVFYSEAKPEEIKLETKNYLVDSEKIIYAYKSTRDLAIFTDKRIVLIDVKGIRGFRTSIYGFAYSSISSYDLTIRNFDSMIELILDSGHKAMMRFAKPLPLDTVYLIYKHIALYKMK